MAGEKKPLVMSELGCADGCGREMGAESCADGCRRVGATAWLEMGGEKKPLVMSELGCADGCGRQMGGENSADGCGQRGCQGVAGNGWGEEAAGDQRAWLRRRLRTGNGCRELRGRLRTAWVQGSGWKWVGRRSRWRSASLAARTAADGKWVRRTVRTAADGAGATEWLEMGGEKKPLVISELGCTDGCGREMGAENCADGCGRPGCKRVAGHGWGVSASLAARTAADGKWVRRIAWTAADGVGAREWLEMGGEKKPLVMSELGCADGCGREMGAENCVDGCGRRGCNGVAGNGWGSLW